MRFAKAPARDSRLILEHVKRYHEDLRRENITGKRVSPVLLPDYGNPEVRKRQYSSQYVGTIR